MSVLNCQRSGCENIMCDRRSFTYGYICDECFDELVESREGFKSFMNSPKKDVRAHKMYYLVADMEFKKTEVAQ